MSGLLRRGLPAMWKVNPLWAFFSVALISLGTLVVACRQVVVGGGRWKGGGMDGGMKGGMNTGPPWPTDWVAQTLSNSSTRTKPTPEHIVLFGPPKNTPTLSRHNMPSPPSTQSVSIPETKAFWWGPLPDQQTAGMESREDLWHGGLVEWFLRDDSGSQWRGYSCCIVSQTSPAQHPPPTHPTPSHLASIAPL